MTGAVEIVRPAVTGQLVLVSAPMRIAVGGRCQLPDHSDLTGEEPAKIRAGPSGCRRHRVRLPRRSTRNRPQVLQEFKNGTAPVFLISLKAGGVGLNLTEADYCMLLDPPPVHRARWGANSLPAIHRRYRFIRRLSVS